MESDKEKMEQLEKIYQEREKRVRLIAGTINATGRTLYWIDEGYVIIGSYVIVENMNGYDLAKVVGVTETTKGNVSKFSNTSYRNMKKIVREIPTSSIEAKENQR
ncbi:MAG: hypothetical protein HFJ48_01595 [Clostridia bacterium]|nr:hypothetical protein [Clostridia bacterium]